MLGLPKYNQKFGSFKSNKKIKLRINLLAIQYISKRQRYGLINFEIYFSSENSLAVLIKAKCE